MIDFPWLSFTSVGETRHDAPQLGLRKIGGTPSELGMVYVMGIYQSKMDDESWGIALGLIIHLS